jgi:hypothetical protein
VVVVEIRSMAETQETEVSFYSFETERRQSCLRIIRIETEVSLNEIPFTNTPLLYSGDLSNLNVT